MPIPGIFLCLLFGRRPANSYNEPMIRRLLAISLLTLLPTVTLADDVLPTPEPSVTQETPAPQQSSGSAALLGPQGSTSSIGDGTSLQPAGNNPLQSGTSDSTGLTSPESSALQGSAPSGDIKVMLGNEADGVTRTPAPESGDNSIIDSLALLLLLSLFGLIWGLRYRVSQRFHR